MWKSLARARLACRCSAISHPRDGKVTIFDTAIIITGVLLIVSFAHVAYLASIIASRRTSLSAQWGICIITSAVRQRIHFVWTAHIATLVVCSGRKRTRAEVFYVTDADGIDTPTRITVCLPLLITVEVGGSAH